jgi:predicted DNA-binding transcriptional regulator YafY
MYHPTTRLLTILELLQAHHTLSGDELARRLEVETRSVRRYITMLQDMGMPIEAVRGPGGGYQLRPGFKLPPLMFSEEEATAIVLGLLGSNSINLGQSALAVEGALAKVLRVLPLKARERLSAFTENLVLSPNEDMPRPAAAMLIDLSEATQRQQPVAIEYRSPRDESTRRTVEPYALAAWWGRWYMVAFCRLRHDFRLFRLDRVRQMQVLDEHFTRASGFDPQAHLNELLGKFFSRYHIVVEFQAPLHRVREKIPASFGEFSETATGTLFSTEHGDVTDVAHFIVSLKIPFVAHEPPELKAELLRLAEQIARSAGGES